MEPVFRDGNILLLKKWGTPEKRDIVTAYIDETDCMVVKRVLGAEGDYIKIFSDGVYLNGDKVAEPASGGQEEQEILLSAGQYFLIGDNQGISRDSRIFGYIEKSAVRGIVICKLF